MERRSRGEPMAATLILLTLLVSSSLAANVEESRADYARKRDTDVRSHRSESLSDGDVTFQRFMDVDEIMSHLEELPLKYPDKVSLTTVGYSAENRTIYLVSVTSNITNNDTQKSIIFVDGGIHPQEWISPAAALNLIRRLLKSAALTRNIEWQIIPLLNPDGYAYTWTTNRLWRKNRGGDSWFCTGTDLNRNFGFQWGEMGSSGFPCSNEYRGPRPFSEPESRALRNAMLPLKNRTEVYVSLHSIGQYLLHPWGYTTNESINYNVEEHVSIGAGMAKAVKYKTSTDYAVGSVASMFYLASGTSQDWAAGALKIPLVYTMVLRDDGSGEAKLNNNLIVPAVHDAWIALKYLGRSLIKKEKKKLAAANKPAKPAEQNPELETSEEQEDDNQPQIEETPPKQEDNQTETTQKTPQKQNNQPETTRKTPQKQNNQPGTTQKTPQKQNNKSGTTQKTPQKQNNQPETTQKTPQKQNNQPGTTQKTPQKQNNKPGTTQKTPQKQNNKPGTTQKTPQKQNNQPETDKKTPQKQEEDNQPESRQRKKKRRRGRPSHRFTPLERK